MALTDAVDERRLADSEGGSFGISPRSMNFDDEGDVSGRLNVDVDHPLSKGCVDCKSGRGGTGGIPSSSCIEKRNSLRLSV